MGACWFCYWGWPLPVADIHDKYLRIAGESAMYYGPAHIVWADENFEREHVQWCLDNYESWCAEWGLKHDGQTPEQWEAVRASLVELLALPDDVLYPVPEAFDVTEDDADPSAFPPPIPTRIAR